MWLSTTPLPRATTAAVPEPMVADMDIDEAVDTVRSAAARVERALADVEAAKQTLQREALKALVGFDGDDGGEQVLISRLYWDVPELPVKTLEAAVGTLARVRQLAGPGPVVGRCDDCDLELRATSRTQLTSGATTCKPCEKKRREAADAERWRPWRDDVPDGPVPPDWYDGLDTPDFGWAPPV